MSMAYLGRLVCLSLACFGLLNVALAAIAALVARPGIRVAERMAAESGAGLLFALRTAPAALSAFAVVAFGLPSYLRFEPQGAAEEVGSVCLAAAALGIAALGAAIGRALSAAVRSARCEAAAKDGAPVLLLAGVFRPRLVVSRGVREALTQEQFAAALRHERAHAASHDNLKRLLILLAPGFGALGQLEHAWRRMAEWAADDAAAAGSPERSLELAAALVRIGRMGIAAPAPPLATSLLADGSDLSARVERLLEARPRSRSRRWTAAPGVVALPLVVLLLHPATLAVIHRWLELLAH